jgi:hypothetical protein
VCGNFVIQYGDLLADSQPSTPHGMQDYRMSAVYHAVRECIAADWSR